MESRGLKKIKVDDKNELYMKGQGKGTVWD